MVCNVCHTNAVGGKRCVLAHVALVTIVGALILAVTSALAQPPPRRPTPPTTGAPAGPARVPTERAAAGIPFPDPTYPTARAEPPAGFFSATRPKVIILIHGATDRPDRKPLVGHLAYARYYWGFAFVRRLLGRTSGGLYTFSNDSLTSGNWPEGAYDVPTGTNLPTFAVRDDSIAHHFVTPDRGSRQLTVMLTHRDGSRGLPEQATDAVNQIFELYNAAFGQGQEPQIILIGHSMGGLVSRYILSNPFSSGESRSLVVRNRAHFIRNRTLHLTTLCTPHEGSRFADLGRGVAELVQQNGPFLQGFFDATGLRSVREYVLTQFTPANDPDIRHLTSAYVQSMNQTELSPERAQRNDGSLIPVYALSARDPAAGMLNRPNMVAVVLGADKRRAYETAGLVVVDQLMKRAMPGGSGWGVPPAGSHDLDWIQRVSLHDLVSGAVDAATGAMPSWATQLVADLGGVLAASGIASFNVHFPIYLDRRWEGSLATVPVPFKHKQYKYGPKFRVSWSKWEAATQNPAQFADAIKRTLQDLGYNLGQLVGSLAYVLNPFDDRCCLRQENWETKTTVDIPGVKLTALSGRPSDGETDNDGLVNLDSGLGLTLGRTGSGNLEFFDHTRQWTVDVGGTNTQVYGSWYRLYTGPWDTDNHATITFNEAVAAWLGANIVHGAGPLPRPTGFSAYGLPTPVSVPAIRRTPPP